ncbi:MAG: DUF2844 domain-containing protein [Pseudomonadota bacterium]|nr:DUF2844 domain-containing protein [Pseudomonadota bacterium]
MTQARRQSIQLMIFATAANLLLATPALAGLGESSETVQSDKLRLRATMKHVDLATHVRHELTLPNGASVHEFTNPQGQVFAIRWSGPGKPDLRSLLGSHFGALQAASEGQSGRFGRMARRAPLVDQPDLKITSGGHMGYFWGLAWLPALLPPGVQPGDLQ